MHELRPRGVFFWFVLRESASILPHRCERRNAG